MAITVFLLINMGLVSCFFISYKTVLRLCKPAQFYEENERKRVQRRRFIEEYNAQEQVLTTKDGIRIVSFFVQRPHAREVLLVCHGFGNSKETMYHVARIFPDSSLLFIDFRAHGQSGGSFCSLGYHEALDIEAAVDFLRLNESTKNMPLIGLGCSMGAAALIIAQGKGVAFDGLILEAPFARLDKELQHAFTRTTGLPRVVFLKMICWIFAYMTNVCVEQVNPVEYAVYVTCPVFLIHSENDEVVPVEHAYLLLESFKNRVQQWIIPHAQHACVGRDHAVEYKRRIDLFLQTFRL